MSAHTLRVEWPIHDPEMRRAALIAEAEEDLPGMLRTWRVEQCGEPAWETPTDWTLVARVPVRPMRPVEDLLRDVVAILAQAMTQPRTTPGKAAA